ncbi:Glycosyl hydrolases family 2, immunoglobulin-like beta-sandwich domain [Verrucomicrobiia bacterium DG1235]|nr:Glycosyl hydrolases family 2, immunoglobulin-like beta-sandwich domain [Verrucomicrobiae bacterium DG1235]
MKKAILGICVFAAIVAGGSLQLEGAGRERTQINDGWRFALGHATDKQADWGHGLGYFSYLAKTGFGDGPAHPAFDDRGWRKIDLPHDWAVEQGFSEEASYSHGFKTVGPGFPENSVGWYRRSFSIPESDLGKRIRIEFDGIYRDAAVFVNGFFVGQEPSGFVSQSYDVSEYLNYGGDNVVVVRADAFMEEGWYYEGAGIYRHAYLLKTDPLHVDRYGVFVSTKKNKKGALVSVKTKMVNEGRASKRFQLSQSIVDADGQVVAKGAPVSVELEAGESTKRNEGIQLRNPSVWDLDTPYLYTLVTSLEGENGVELDRYETRFGVREIRFDPDEGFFLNGRSVKLKGTNNHHDHAGIGAALPDAMQEYRIRLLKEMGSNAYRVSHHHASPALLDACDRLGMLVIDENRLMGINDYHLGQLEHLILRGRNHPSVILWSVGNEEWGIEGNVKGARIATYMQDFAKRLDPTRMVTAAISGGWGGISKTIEVMGVNYIKHGDTDRQHADYPDQIIVGTEETTTQQTRGIYFEDASLAHQPPMENGSSGGNAESGWRHYAERDYAAGIFYWTGFDYRGEPTPYGWPAVVSQFGILDICGFPKDGYYYLKSWWTDEPVLHIFPHWNWSGKEGETIEVRAHSNCEEVELFLNGVSQGRKTMRKNDHLAWDVVYEPGELEARGYKGGKQTLSKVVVTTGASSSVELVANRQSIAADGQDVAVIEMRILDADGSIVPTANDQAHFSITGPGKIIGVGNGNPSSHEPDQYHAKVATVKLGEWSAPPAADTESLVVFEARFDRPDISEEDSAQLLLGALGREQRLILNGKILYEGADRKAAAAAIDYETLTIKDTDNVLRIEAKPFVDWGEREAIAQNHPALLGVHSSGAAYKRKAFSGLAQVIVQSTGEAGDIVLKAEAEGLEGGSVSIEARESK